MGGGFASGLAGKIGPNTYIDEMKGQIANDANDIRQQSLGSLDARAAAAGMSGSSGYRDQVAGMNDDVNEQALNAMTNVGLQQLQPRHPEPDATGGHDGSEPAGRHGQPAEHPAGQL